MSRILTQVLHDARRALDLGSQGALGEALGSSKHTGQRWALERATPTGDQLRRLAAMVYPRNAALAGELAAHAGTSVEALGLVPPPPPATPPMPVPIAAPPPPPPPDPIHIVDTVVCAAAEALHMMPDAIRPALRAAFRRARLAGLSVEAVDVALNGAEPPARPARGR